MVGRRLPLSQPQRLAAPELHLPAAHHRELTKMPNGNVISIADRLRETRIQSLIKRLSASFDRLERRMICAQLECELKEHSPETVEAMERRMGLV